MGVTFIAPAEQFTSPAKLITKEITEDGTYYAADDNANGYSSVEVSVGGGGGITGVKQINITGACTGGAGYELFLDNLHNLDYSNYSIGARIDDTGTQMTSDGMNFTSSTPTTMAWYIPETVTETLYIFVSGMGSDISAYTVTGGAEKVKLNPDDPDDPQWELKVTGDFSIAGPGEN